jgi:uncharacterized protein (DUF2141 family)
MIKRLSLVFFCFVLSSLSLKSQNTLTIEIRNLKNNKGKVFLELRDGKDRFVQGVTATISNNHCVITIKNLREGAYSFKFFHDENNNRELDTNWLGVPTEGFGFSNNVLGAFGPPAFEKTVFKLKGIVHQKCTPRYY